MTEETIFIEALEIADPEARAAFLDRACSGNPDARVRLDKLLAEHAEAGSFLGSPAPLLLPTDIQELVAEGGTSDIPAARRDGTAIGPYKLVEVIGEGGMGTVWLAQQQVPVKRLVAVKVIKAGMDSKSVLARFEAERQALALMDHPNIARVLDAGASPDGRPYFVMELVKGVPITKFCDERKLTPRQRLELFVPVCQAVQHAHQKGVIHRDIKPSNVMVALYDGRPVPKVIDFGIAKAAGQPLTEKTLITGLGAVVGTPEYMSPEQAELNQLDIDTRSDVYSLGILLYELLTGSTPLQHKRVKEAALLEVLRLVREEEPVRPSTRLSTTEELPSIAANRGVEPRKLSGLVRGELDWIVMKALEKERTRRYETANGFARDIQRYLADEVVDARPPSAGYRLQKAIRRNKVALTTATLVSLALLIGTVVSTWQAIRATRAEILAKTAQEDESKQRKIAEQERNDAIAARAAEAEQRMAAEANLQKARKAVDEYFTLVSESTLLDVPGLQPLRKQLLESALNFYQGLAAEWTADPAMMVDLAVTNMRVAEINHIVDRNDDAVAALDRALDAIDGLRRDFPDAGEQHRRLAGYWKGCRRSQESTQMPKNPEAAVRSLSRLIGMWETLAKEYPDELRFQSDLAALLHRTGDLLQSGGQRPEGVKFFERARDILERLSHDHSQIPEYRADLARAYQYLASNFAFIHQRKAEADGAARKALALREQLIAENPKLPQYRQDLAFSLIQCARALRDREANAEAEDYYRRAFDLTQVLLLESPMLPVHMSRYCDACAGLCNRLMQRGAYDEAEKILRQAFEVDLKPLIHRPTDTDMRLRLANLYVDFSRALSATDRQNEAEVSARHAMALVDLVAKSPPNANYRWHLAGSHEALGSAFSTSGRKADAETKYRDALALWDQLVAEAPTNHDYRWHLAVAHDELGKLLKDADRFQDATEAYRHALPLWEKLSAETNSDDHRTHLSWTRGWLVESLVGRAKQLESGAKPSEAARQSADQAYRDAIAVWEKPAADAPKNDSYQAGLGHTLWQVADAWAASGRRDEAEQLFRQSAAHFETLVREAPANTAYCHSSAYCQNTLAWWLVMRPDATHAQTNEAVELARRAVELAPNQSSYWNTLGTVYYRAGNWQEALAALSKSLEMSPNYEAFNTFFIAMCHWRLGNQEEARKWYERAVGSANVPAAHSEELHRFHVEAGELLDVKDAPVRIARARLHIRQSRWNEAADEYAMATDLLSAVNRDAWFEHAGLRILVKDSEGYRDFCRQMTDRAGQSFDPFTAYVLARAGTMSSEPVIEAETLVTWARQAVDSKPDVPWHLHVLGLAYYRAGQFELAVETLEKSEKSGWQNRGEGALNELVLAMAHHRLGRSDEAQSWLAKAEKRIEAVTPATSNPVEMPTPDWLEIQVLRREANALLRTK